MQGLFLGIDTSNYKTSAAVTDSSGRVLYQRSEYLEVPHGSRGLRQSECFFRHSLRLPEYIDELCKEVSASDICSVGVSSRPRRIEGSYMPCFLAGLNAAKEIASVLGVPLYEFSHQEGHAAAVLDGTADRSILMHLSGGTTEILLCSPDDRGYDLQIIGGTRDISVGQLIDRAGVAMGFDFPSGMYLDELAGSYMPGNSKPELPRIRIQDGYFNLSGTETQVMKWIDSADPSDYSRIAYSLFFRIAELLASASSQAAELHSVDKVFMAGGVSASTFIREMIERQDNLSSQAVFGDPVLSGDNAVGISMLTQRIFNESSNCNSGK